MLERYLSCQTVMITGFYGTKTQNVNFALCITRIQGYILDMTIGLNLQVLLKKSQHPFGLS